MTWAALIPWKWLGITAAVGIMAWTAYDWSWDRGYAEAHAELSAVIADERAAVQAERDAFERHAREAEAKHQSDMDAIAAQHEQAKTDAKTKYDSDVAALRDGNLRLHQRWQAAVATADLASASQSAAELDAAARDREESAARIIAAAREADDTIRGLQAVILADRAMQ